MIPYFSHIIFFIIQYIQNTFGSFQSGVFQIIENFLIQLFCTSIASCILARLVAVRWNAFAATTSSLISWLSECNIDYQTWRQLGKSPAIINKNKSIKIDVFLLSCSSNYIKQISSFRTLSFFHNLVIVPSFSQTNEMRSVCNETLQWPWNFNFSQINMNFGSQLSICFSRFRLIEF